MEPIARLNDALSSRYEVVREIGAGGMATVYLARDLKHGRNVALKVLKPELGAVLGVARFLSEIKVTANLQHPNLLPLFDSGEADGLLFYVMPFVDGETLRARIECEKQLPIDEAVAIACAVARGLAYAHERGVIHRDLKPENILLQAGQPLIADFGIALAVSNAGGQRVTESGLSLGTPQYMSPEQAVADRAIDGRSDIYSLAAVTYEMLTGEPPHTGSTAQAVLSRVINETPRPIRASRASVPVYIERAVHIALSKLPADRFASAREFVDALSGRVVFAPSGATARARNLSSGDGWRSIALRAVPWGIAAVSIVVAAIALTNRPFARSPGAVIRTSLGLPELLLGDGLAIAADGATIAVLARDTGDGTAAFLRRQRIYVRRSDQLESHALEGTEGARSPVFSPDGRWIAFVRGDSLVKVPTAGGPPNLVARAANIGGDAGWASDSQIVFSARGALYEVSAAGGEPKLLLAKPADTAYSSPVPLPGGKAVLFNAASSAGDCNVRVLDVQSGKVRTVIPQGVGAQYVATGHLLYSDVENCVAGRTRLAVPFDLGRVEVTGEAVTVLQHVAGLGVSTGGTLVYRTAAAVAARLFIVDERGPGQRLPPPADEFRGVRLSPDARRVAYGRNAGGAIFVYDLSLGTITPVITAGAWDPLWSLDGRRIAFQSFGPNAIGRDGFEIAADGTGERRQLFRDSSLVAPQAWLSDGRLLARTPVDLGGGGQVFLLTFKDSSAKKTPYLTADYAEDKAVISPDDHWVAFRSNESGGDEVYVRPFPDASGGNWKLSERGGTDPVWSRDGRTVYWWEGFALRAAHLRTQPSFAVLSRETVLTDDAYLQTCCFPNYDVYPDGKRFIMARRVGVRQDAGLVLVVNWFEELKAKMGQGAGGAKKP